MVKQDKHEALSKLKALASDLGKVPTRHDAREAGIDYLLQKFFGGFSVAMQAAGLTVQQKAKTKSKNILQGDIALHLKDRKRRTSSLTTAKSVLIIGDTHFPFCHLDSLQLVYALAEALQPNAIIQIGDLYDMFAHSSFPRSTIGWNAKEEMDIGRKQAVGMWTTLKKLVPGAELHQIFGNHDMRPLKRVLQHYPAGEIFFEFNKWYEFAGVRLQKDAREPVIIDGVYYEHGYSSRLGHHRDHNQNNTVVGHTHRGGVAYKKIQNKTMWELNAGFLGDAESKGLSYTQTKVTQWTLGVGYVSELGPQFIPFET